MRSRSRARAAPQGAADDNYDDGDDGQPFMGQNEPSYAPQPPAPQAQPYLPRDAQPFPPRDQQQPNRPQHQPQQQPYVQPPVQGGNVAVPDPNALAGLHHRRRSRSRMPPRTPIRARAERP